MSETEAPPESAAVEITPDAADDHGLAVRYWIYAVIFFAWVSWMYYATYKGSSFAEWVNGWHRWDAEWYFRIWNLGYGDDPRMLVFPPGYSWIVGYTSSILKIPFDLAALVVNMPATFGAAVISTEFLSKKFRVPGWPLFIAFFCYPCGAYAFSPYTDYFFAFLFWSATALADPPPRTTTWKQRLVGWFVIALAPFVRLTGFALAIWLLFGRWFALAVLPALVLILLGNYLVTGNPLYFLHAQGLFVMPSGGFFMGLRYHLHDLTRVPYEHGGNLALFWFQVTILPLFSLILISISAWWLARRRAWLLAVTLITVAIFSRNQAYWRSVFRYDLILVPLIVLPWVDWAVKRTRGWRATLRSVSASVFFGFLLVIGFLLQWAFARHLHNGIWLF